MKSAIHKAKKSRRRQQCGSLLLDVVTALWVVVIGFLPIAAMLVAAQLTDRQAQIQTVAANAAELEIETLRSQSFANTAAMSTGSFTIQSSLLTPYPNVSMVGNYAISTASGLGDSTHKVLQIAVMVKWTRPDTVGTFSSVRMDTYESQGANG